MYESVGILINKTNWARPTRGPTPFICWAQSQNQ